VHTVLGEHDPLDIKIVFDPDAEQTDWDDALAVFLLTLVRKRTSISGETEVLNAPNDNDVVDNRRQRIE